MHKVYLFQHKGNPISDEFIRRMLEVLPEERKEKALRYRKAVDRNNCVIAYLMLKMALMECFHICHFTMKYGEYGKPYLEEYPGIHFSMSHSGDGCVVAVADERIGVDIQDLVPFSWEIAYSVCHAEEIEALETSQDKQRDFIRMWAVKESYLKMTGEGITQKLQSVNSLKMNWIEIEERENSIIAVCSEKKTEANGKS